MAPSAPATASTSVAGESAASFVGGGSPKVPSSLKAAAPRERSAAVSSGPGGTGSAGTVGVSTGGEKQGDRVVVAALRRPCQRGLSIDASGIGLGTGSDQQLGDLRVPLAHGA